MLLACLAQIHADEASLPSYSAIETDARLLHIWDWTESGCRKRPKGVAGTRKFYRVAWAVFYNRRRDIPRINEVFDAIRYGMLEEKALVYGNFVGVR